MGKTLVYVVLLGILGFGVYFFFFKSADNLYQEKDANFTFRDTAAIGKIFLVDNNGTSILLERQADNKWLLNKEFPAMPLQIVNILTCLKMQTAFSPVPARDHDRVVKLLAGLATKVEVYDRKGNKMRAFYVAGQGPNYHGSYMILEGAQQPYLVEIQGFDGYLTPRYTVEFNDWHSRTLIALSEADIASIEIQYPEDPSNSFKMSNTGASPTISGPAANSASPLNIRRALSYLTFFKNVNAEGLLNGIPHLDSTIANAKLRCKFIAQAKDNKQIALDIYWIPLSEQEQEINAQEGSVVEQVERHYCVNRSSNDTFLIQTRTFEKLLQKGAVFYQQ